MLKDLEYSSNHPQSVLLKVRRKPNQPIADSFVPKCVDNICAAFPLAMFFHAHCPEDMTYNLLTGKLTVILVDSVINSGKTIVQFVQQIRSLHATARCPSQPMQNGVAC
jgi:hypothetical protein